MWAFELLQSPADDSSYIWLTIVLVYTVICVAAECLWGKGVQEVLLIPIIVLGAGAMLFVLYAMFSASIHILMEEGAKAIVPCVLFWGITGIFLFVVIRAIIKKKQKDQ